MKSKVSLYWKVYLIENFLFHLSPEIKNYLNNLVFSIHNVSYGASFLRVRSIDLSGKKLR